MRHSKQKTLAAHLRRLSLMALNIIINNSFAYSVIGLLNKRRKFIKTVFVAYPATEEYALSYVYPWYRHKMKWSPWPVGIYEQNGKWGLMTVISSIEKDFLDDGSLENMEALIKKTERIRKLVNAEQVSYAGILPGVFHKKSMSKSIVEAAVTIEAVTKAEKALRASLDYPDDTPLIILGAKGFIGSRIIAKYCDREIYKIDIDNRHDFPVHLKGQKVILINLTKKAALSQYLDKFWQELVLLNEAYPEPSARELKALTEKGSLAYHVVGVKARSYPSFPKAYKGGIPCCAAWSSPEMEVIIKKLNNPDAKNKKLAIPLNKPVNQHTDNETKIKRKAAG